MAITDLKDVGSRRTSDTQGNDFTFSDFFHRDRLFCVFVIGVGHKLYLAVVQDIAGLILMFALYPEHV